MSKKLTNAQLQEKIAQLEAQIAAQAAIMPLSHETAPSDCRAANFEPLQRGSKLAKNPSVTLKGATGSCSHSSKLRRVIPILALLVQALGPVFKGPEAKRYMVMGITTSFGECARWAHEGSANTWLCGAKARILSEAPELVAFSGTKPETWAVNLHTLAELSR